MRPVVFTLLTVFSHALDLASGVSNQVHDLVRRQAYGGPLYSPCGPGGCGPGSGPGCSPGCMGQGCVGGGCGCPGPALYNPMVGCAPPVPLPPPPPMPPAPSTAGRLIPQALPGAPCEPGVECTGGSVCSMGICLCPPELVQEGTVCVSRTIYGVVPGGPQPVPPPPPMPMAYPAMPAPMPVRPTYFDPCIIKRSTRSTGSSVNCN